MLPSPDNSPLGPRTAHTLTFSSNKAHICTKTLSHSRPENKRKIKSPRDAPDQHERNRSQKQRNESYQRARPARVKFVEHLYGKEGERGAS